MKRVIRATTEYPHITDFMSGIVHIKFCDDVHNVQMPLTAATILCESDDDLYEEDEDILEDAIIENKQAIEMSQIYSNILATTMEASASIISNNLNTVMKILTSITIVIAIPTLIASFWGMNVPVPFQNNPFGFFITIIISVLLGVSASLLLKKSNMLS